MDIPENIKQHVTEETAKEVTEICQPLFDALNLNFFCYTRLYKDKSVIAISTACEPVYYAFEAKAPVTTTFIPSGFNLWSEYRSDEFLQHEADHFGFYNGTTITKDAENYRECLILAAPKNNVNAIGICFNSQDFLRNFLLYFKDKADFLIDKACQNKVVLPDYMIGKPLPQRNYEDFLSLIKTNNIRFDFHDQEVVISRREYECLQQLSKGKSMKETAAILEISSRTVEQYVARAKEKTKLYSRSQLVDLIHENVISI